MQILKLGLIGISLGASLRAAIAVSISVKMVTTFKFPNMKKYSGIDDPHLHLKQYVTYMKATGLSKA